MQHKKACKVLPPNLDINLDLPELRDEGFNDTDQAPEGNASVNIDSNNCNLDGCEKLKLKLKKQRTAAQEKTTQLILENINFK